MTTKVEVFNILGGAEARIGDVGGCDLWVLIIGGATLKLGFRADWTIEVDPFPHAWRVAITPKGSESSIWFDVPEDAAMRIDALTNPL